MTYRVSWLHRGSHLPHGWHKFVRVYATEAEAIEAVSNPFGRCVVSAEVEHSIDGRWVYLGERRRKQEFVRVSR